MSWSASKGKHRKARWLSLIDIGETFNIPAHIFEDIVDDRERLEADDFEYFYLEADPTEPPMVFVRLWLAKRLAMAGTSAPSRKLRVHNATHLLLMKNDIAA